MGFVVTLGLGCGRIGFGVSEPTDGSSGDSIDGPGGDAGFLDGPAACLTNPSYVTVGGLTSKYKPGGIDLSWPAAKAACEADGAYLPILDDAAEANNSIIGDWVGITDVAVEGVWMTVKGDPAPFEPWEPGEPDGGTTENCGRLEDNQLESRDCADTRDYSCECS